MTINDRKSETLISMSELIIAYSEFCNGLNEDDEYTDEQFEDMVQRMRVLNDSLATVTDFVVKTQRMFVDGI